MPRHRRRRRPRRRPRRVRPHHAPVTARKPFVPTTTAESRPRARPGTRGVPVAVAFDLLSSGWSRSWSSRRSVIRSSLAHCVSNAINSRRSTRPNSSSQTSPRNGAGRERRSRLPAMTTRSDAPPANSWRWSIPVTIWSSSFPRSRTISVCPIPGRSRVLSVNSALADMATVSPEVVRVDDDPDSADIAAVTELLGRRPGGRFRIVVRHRDDESPVVIRNDPLLDDGRPMPTRYWLLGEPERTMVGRLESRGGVRRAEEAVGLAVIAEAHAAYAAERDAALPPNWSGPRPSAGVGGTRVGVKCLHAHYAWYLAGGDDPVGRWVAARLAAGEGDRDRPTGTGADRFPSGPGE